MAAQTTNEMNEIASATDGNEVEADVEYAGDKCRNKRISNAEHSLGDLHLIADIPAMDSKELNDVPHVLKTFYTWMNEGPSKKSAKNYTESLKRLIVSHRRTLEAMRDDRYFAFVKTSVENCKCNSLVSAALKKLIFFFAEREHGTDGPWEHRAAGFETLFNLSKGHAPWGGAAMPAMAPEKKANNFFARKEKKDNVPHVPLQVYWKGQQLISEVNSETPPPKRSLAAMEASDSPNADEPSAKAVKLSYEDAADKKNKATNLLGGQLSKEQIAAIEAKRQAALVRRTAKVQAWAKGDRVQTADGRGVVLFIWPGGDISIKLDSGGVGRYTDTAIRGTAYTKDVQEKTYAADNSILQTTSPGILFRQSKNLKDRYNGDKCILDWGSTVRGVDCGDGWLEVGDRNLFLPTHISGDKVLVDEAEAGKKKQAEAEAEEEAAKKRQTEAEEAKNQAEAAMAPCANEIAEDGITV